MLFLFFAMLIFVLIEVMLLSICKYFRILLGAIGSTACSNSIWTTRSYNSRWTGGFPDEIDKSEK